VGYDDLKEDGGKVYSGMPVGGEHAWEYPNGIWLERKVAPDRWTFTFRSLKRRTREAPAGSGVPVGTQYHWFILAHQKVRKLDKDTYETLMDGVKYKVAHRRPFWRRWNTEYPDQVPEREVLIGILERELALLRATGDTGIGTSPSGSPPGEGNGLVFPDRVAMFSGNRKEDDSHRKQEEPGTGPQGGLRHHGEPV